MLDQAAHQKAADIGRQLAAGGFAHAMAKYLPEADVIGVNFILCSANPPWRKLLVLAPEDASADEFLALFRKWQSNMLTRMATGDLSDAPNLKGALAVHGESAVKIALHA